MEMAKRRRKGGETKLQFHQGDAGVGRRTATKSQHSFSRPTKHSLDYLGTKHSHWLATPQPYEKTVLQ